MSESLSNLVAALPEIYQVVYGHPELTQSTSRTCEDRLVSIGAVYDALAAELGRPLRVLDLGCAQGYFSLALAARGAEVRGVDFLDRNIALCQALAAENPQLKAQFEVARVEDVIAAVQPGQYDLVLGLSVLHHVVHEHGVAQVCDWLGLLAEHCSVLLVELALREEPLYWGQSLPEQPTALLRDFSFVHEVRRFPTHLSEIARPLVVASNSHCICGAQAWRIQRWSAEAHALSGGTHQATRRYFWLDGAFAKLIGFDGPRGALNQQEFDNELTLLSQPLPGFAAAQLLGHCRSEGQGLVVMEQLPGRLLLDVLQAGEKVQPLAVLLPLLRQLEALEAAGRYHQDIRTWNLLLNDAGELRLIDFGSIAPQARDCVWPENIFLAFLIFVHELVSGQVADPSAHRALPITPFDLPEPLRQWLLLAWQQPLAQWSFRMLRETLEQRDSLPAPQAEMPADIWAAALEQVVQAQKLHMGYLQEQLGDARAHQQMQDHKIRLLEEWVERQEQFNRQTEQWNLAIQQRDNELQALYLSSSWRLTAPLRWLNRKLRAWRSGR